jgi:hypothetical protein
MPEPPVEYLAIGQNKHVREPETDASYFPEGQVMPKTDFKKSKEKTFNVLRIILYSK